MTGAEAPNALSIIGEDIKDWSKDKGLDTSDGAVFWMNPKDGPSASDTNGAQGKGSPTGNVIVAQLTVKTGTTFDAQVQMRTAPTWSCAFCVANTHVLLPPGQLPGAHNQSRPGREPNKLGGDGDQVSRWRRFQRQTVPDRSAIFCARLRRELQEMRRQTFSLQGCGGALHPCMMDTRYALHTYKY